MTSAVVYSSKTGNTKAIAQAIGEALPKAQCVYIGEPKKEGAEADIIFAGFWTDKGNCDQEMAAFLEGLKGKKVALFGTAGFGGSQEYFQQLAQRFAQHLEGSNQLVGSYFCQGKMPQAVRIRYEKMAQDAPQDPKVKGMLENFDRAASHPDQIDLAQAQDFARQIWNQIQ